MIPSIEIFVRHAAGCRYRDDEGWKRCDCRKHLRWTFDGKQYRRSAKTRSWAIFNLANHPNFGPPVNTGNPNGAGGSGDAIFAGGVRLASAGRIFQTVNTSRQIQLGMKILF